MNGFRVQIRAELARGTGYAERSPASELAPGPLELAAVAMDKAGNESAPVTVLVVVE